MTNATVVATANAAMTVFATTVIATKNAKIKKKHRRLAQKPKNRSPSI